MERPTDSKLGRKHQGEVDKKELKSFRSEMQDGTMATILDIYFALLLLNRKANLCGNQVSDTGPFGPLLSKSL